MKQQYTLLLGALAALLFPMLHAHASLNDYAFSVTKGKYIESKGEEIFVGPNADNDESVSKVYDIGFTFYLDGVPYNSFSVNNNGLIGLGSNPTTPCWANQLVAEKGACDGVGGYDYTLFQTPHITAFWDDLKINAGGSIRYSVVGKEPNRVLVIDFQNMNTFYYGVANSSWQTRLYEGSNKIEFYYDYMDPNYDINISGGGASVGIAMSSSNFISVSANYDYDRGEPSYSVGGKPDDYVSPVDGERRGFAMFPSGTMLVFNPCMINISLNPDEGGLNPLLNDREVVLGASADFMPLALSLDGECKSATYRIKIGGTNASDYRVEPAEGEVNGQKGDPVSPVITFSPSGVGVRSATLTIIDDHDRTFSYELAAVGTSRIIYVPDVAQGGTVDMASGDTLMRSVVVRRGRSEEFTPFSLLNTNTDTDLPGASITYSIVGTSGGQYSISPGSSSIRAGETTTPVITFSPTGIGAIVDTLVVNVEGGIRKFILMAASDAIGATLSIDNVGLASGSRLFNNTLGCVNSGAESMPIDVQNIGTIPFSINGLDVYAVDTAHLDRPPYALLLGTDGKPISISDYIITEEPYAPGVATHYPIVVPQGTTRTVYLTFVGSQSGRRYGRAFLATDAENFVDRDVEGNETQGLISFDLFARGVGAKLSSGSDGSLLKSLVFPPTEIAHTAQLSLPIYNNGLCMLRIDTKHLIIASGDVTEFTIVEPPTDDILLAPGESTSITVSFTPTQVGSRRATIAIATNDPTVTIDGGAVPGVYYFDLYGVGGSGLYIEADQFAPAVIAGDPDDYSHGEARVINNGNTFITIKAIDVVGDDAGDFVIVGTWPTLPMNVGPGQMLHLGLAFAPRGGTSGMRHAQVRVTTGDDKVLETPIEAFAGTRVLVVDRDEMNFIGTTARGSRQTLVISNVGTMALKLNDVVLAGSESSGFALGDLPRLEFAPGQSEQLEISYNPSSAGASSATLTLTSNVPGSGSTVIVKLNGQAQQSQGLGEDPSESAMGGDRYGDGSAVVDEGLRLSGVEGEVMVSGMALRQSVPNPGRDEVTISYVLRNGGEVSLVLYDGVGSLVKVLDAGVRESGEYVVGLDVHGLSSGVYHYRLSVGGKVLDRSLRVVH